MKAPVSPYDIEVTTIGGRPQKTEAYRGRTLRSSVCGRYALPLIFCD